MLHWRATGQIVVIKRSAWGLHIALACPFVDLLEHRRRDLHWAISLCTDPALAERLFALITLAVKTLLEARFADELAAQRWR